MKIKEYQVFKSAGKTAKQNNLVLCDGIINKAKRLFDFSILNDAEILGVEKEYIKNDAIKYVCASSREQIYMGTINEFEGFSGVATYHNQRVYSVDGRLLYNILTLARLEHGHGERQTIYEQNYQVKETKISNGYDLPINDIEVA